jgi:3alpha(or 20beta)-hydroxysteroid dehydrogenase
MSGALAGRHALITGAAGGMGRATALRFAQEGASLVVTDAVPCDATADAVRASGGVARAVTLDVTDEAAWAALADGIRADDPPLDALVHCAGVGSGAASGSSDTAGYARLMEVNALGALLAVRTGVELMRDRGGSIITIGSVTALTALDSPELNVGYAASKSAVRSLTRSFARQEGRHGIRVNCILPGFMPPMRGSRMTRTDGDETPYLARIPLGRTGEVAEVAAAALFLASDDSRYITGIDLPVDGGFLA